MVLKRHRKRVRNKLRKRPELSPTLQGNKEESGSGKDGKDLSPGVDQKTKVILHENKEFNKFFEGLGNITSIEEDWNVDSEKLGHKTDLEKLAKERGKIYGDPFLSHQAIGLVWEGLFRNRYHELQDDLNHLGPVGKLFPADLVAEFLAGFKQCRYARPVYHQDSIDDQRVYNNFSERFRRNKI